MVRTLMLVSYRSHLVTSQAAYLSCLASPAAGYLDVRFIIIVVYYHSLYSQLFNVVDMIDYMRR